MNAFEIVHDLAVWDPHRENAQRRHEFIPRSVIGLRFVRRMAFAIHLDDQLQFDAIKIGDVEADVLLSAEFHSHLSVAQNLP